MKESIFQNRVSTLLQMVSIFAIVTAFFGFLVVNMYLSFFGFWDFNFLKIQYFSAGTLFLFYLLVPTVCFYIFLNARKILVEFRDEGKTKIKSFFVPIFIFFFLILSVALNVFGFLFFLSPGNKHAAITVIFCIFSILWGGIISGVVAILLKSHTVISKRPERMTNIKDIAGYFWAYYRLLYPLIAAPVLLLIFSFIIYPVVPRYFGGGKPTTVNISFGQNFGDVQSKISNPFEALLIYQSADSLLVQSGAGTYLLKQSDIAYIKYPEVDEQLKQLESIFNVNFATSTPLIIR